MVRLHLTSKWVGIIAIKTERTLILSAEREVKDWRRSGMSQSCFLGDKIGHAKSVGFRLYSAIRRSESRFSLRCREINSISLLFEEETIIFVA